MFVISETDTYKANIKKSELKIYAKKISEQVYPILRSNPFYGANIKKLKGELSEIYRYRVGSFRLFYLIVESEKRVVILSLRDRKDAY
jgi:mRNA interferase RelE/StbE